MHVGAEMLRLWPEREGPLSRSPRQIPGKAEPKSGSVAQTSSLTVNR